jgi:hypothetical protein
MRSAPTTPTRRRFREHWLMTGVLAAVLAVGALAVTRVDVSAANLQIAQCNSGNGGGSVIACSVTVVNNLNGNLTSSTVTVARHCAGLNTNCGETTGTTTRSNNLVTSVNQCNSGGNGGGSTLTCHVSITNNIVGGRTTTPTTVNQCVGSGDGLGAPKSVCSPFPATTTGADVTQCNGSANGGTLVGLHCTVLPSRTSAALRVTVNQCNGSDNGGGSKVTCDVHITNNTISAGSGGSGGGTPVPNTGGAMPMSVGLGLLLAGVGSIAACVRPRWRRGRRAAR